MDWEERELEGEKSNDRFVLNTTAFILVVVGIPLTIAGVVTLDKNPGWLGVGILCISIAACFFFGKPKNSSQINF